MESSPNTQDFQKYYNDGAFWHKLASFAKKAGTKLIYIALLLYYTLNSSGISKMDRAAIYGALGYFIFPLDIIPDYIPFIGYTDDLSVLLYAYSRIHRNINDDIRQSAKNKMKSFFGSYSSKDIEGY